MNAHQVLILPSDVVTPPRISPVRMFAVVALAAAVGFVAGSSLHHTAHNVVDVPTAMQLPAMIARTATFGVAEAMQMPVTIPTEMARASAEVAKVAAEAPLFEAPTTFDYFQIATILIALPFLFDAVSKAFKKGDKK
eukprot:TRINITY_DN974_c0_g1_i1.p1 TRINITY_DN974_c0_g1~~TRINITY_DN974_c0_g1_i1.p1  ORF type:complete len:147 (+),score=37.37 TRINITY_DN974_c0_g1_i1:32-442(+)